MGHGHSVTVSHASAKERKKTDRHTDPTERVYATTPKKKSLHISQLPNKFHRHFTTPLEYVISLIR